MNIGCNRYLNGNLCIISVIIDLIGRGPQPLTLLLGLMLLLLLVSPLILYRPFMAWISSVIGRSGLLKTAFAKTEGNYWRFVAMAAIFNAAFVVFEGLDEMFDLPAAAPMVIYAPLLVYFNAAIAKTYEFFFLDSLED